MFKKISLRLRALMGEPGARLALKVIQQPHQKVAVFGMGVIGKSLVDNLLDIGCADRLVKLTDSKAEYNAFQYAGFAVEAPTQLNNSDADIIVVASEKFIQDMVEQLQETLTTPLPILTLSP